MSSVRLMIIGFMAVLATGCSNIGNMFSGRGPDRPFETTTTPDVRDTLKSKPEGLVADRDNVRHTGTPMEPQ